MPLACRCIAQRRLGLAAKMTANARAGKKECAPNENETQAQTPESQQFL
jgi:hypothetical protein